MRGRWLHVLPVVAWTAGAFAAGEPAATVQAPRGLDSDIHRQRAAEVTNHIQERFHDRRSGLYFKEAGGREPDMMWGNGVMFSALVGAARHDKSYQRVMRGFFAAMDAYWDENAEVPGYEPARTQGGNDKYYDDNAWMVLSFLEAFEVTGDTRYRRRAEQTLSFVLSGWDDEAGGGIWWHEGHKEDSKNTCANAPTALGCYRLARFSSDSRAARMNEWGDRNTAVHYASWKEKPPKELIAQASLARELWLLADLETAEGRASRARSDKGRGASPPGSPPER